jgi:hypothetical protein
MVLVLSVELTNCRKTPFFVILSFPQITNHQLFDPQNNGRLGINNLKLSSVSLHVVEEDKCESHVDGEHNVSVENLCGEFSVVDAQSFWGSFQRELKILHFVLIYGKMKTSIVEQLLGVI